MRANARESDHVRSFGGTPPLPAALARGTGSIQQTLSLPANQQVTYTLTATVVSPAPAFVENMARLTISNAAPHYVFDPDSADHIAIDVNLGDGLFRSGFELP